MPPDDHSPPGLVRATTASGDPAAERLPAGGFSERQARQRQQYMGEAASSQKPLLWTSRRSPEADGVIASLMAAQLYGGQASVSGDLTPQTRQILERCEQSAPEPSNALAGSQIGLVAVNQSRELDQAIKPAQVVAIVDHHASGSGAWRWSNRAELICAPGGRQQHPGAASPTLGRGAAQTVGLCSLGGHREQTKGLQSARTTAQTAKAQRAWPAAPGSSRLNCSPPLIWRSAELPWPATANGHRSNAPRPLWMPNGVRCSPGSGGDQRGSQSWR